MPKAIAPEIKEKCRTDYLENGLSLAAVATANGVSERLILKWSAAEGWAEEKAKRYQSQPLNIVSFERPRSQSQAAEVMPTTVATDFSDPHATRLILEETIRVLQVRLANPADSRAAGQIATALCRAIREYESAIDDVALMQRLIDRCNNNPRELVTKLRDAGFGR